MQSKQQLALTYLEHEPSAAAKILESITETAVAELLAIAPISTAAQVFEQLSTGKGIACLDAMGQQTAAHLLTQLSATNAATLLKGLSQTKRKVILHQVPTLKAQAIQILLAYPANVVGAWMNPEVLTLRNTHTVADALQQLKSFQGNIPHRLFILERRRYLVGVISATDIMGYPESRLLSDCMATKPAALQSRLQLTLAQQHADWGHSIVMPVVNRHNEFIGVLNYSTLNTAIEQLKNMPDKTIKVSQMDNSLGLLISDSVTGVWQALRDAWNLSNREEKNGRR
ncbi:magnesium transporter MgtE N-terminal domain-containing protein [Zooshikella ganghwensis]|uniref:magnesium transporter MgtE N-terminal domain-containing protein n=1 Tax=Zooshikella ganghwensis TaxID=202772 RepID=UPI00041A5011|nr:CBS domain-containing protein [Zooshikella ganghwensis]